MLLVNLILLASCGSSINEPEYNNPRDKLGTDYIPPKITSVKFYDLNTKNPTVTWTGEPNSNDYRYEYKIDEGDWKNKEKNPSDTLSNLNEGSHEFSVRLVTDIDTSVVETKGFDIDAIKSPGIVFSPREITDTSTVSVYLELDEIDKLMGAHIEIICEEGCADLGVFTGNNASVSSKVFHEYDGSSRLKIDFAYLGGNNGISGSYKIGSFVVTPKQNLKDGIKVDSNSVIFRNVNNVTMRINGLDTVSVNK